MSEHPKNKNSRRLLKLIYRISLTTSGLGFVACIVSFYLFGGVFLSYFHLTSIFLYGFCAYLTKKNDLYYSRIILFILLNFGITLTASFVGRPGGVEYMYIYSLALPFSVFSFRREKVFVYSFSWLSGILWIILAVTDFKLFYETPIDKELAVTYVYPISTVLVFIIVLIQLSYFSILGVKYYSKIHSKRQEAIDASEAKSKFLSTMSHEIRTPLNAIIGLSHILKENRPRQNQIDNIEALNFSGKILLNLLNNVLDFSKMQSIEIELDNIPTDLYDAFKQLKKIYEPNCIKKGIELQINIDKDIPTIMLDIVRFNQVINNLLNNAIKFTDEGKVILNIKKGVENKGKINVFTEILDTGIGIPKGKQKKIWEPFTQASDSTTRIYGGTGLGLPIVKSIVEAMGSKIVLRSKVGRGSRFSFKLKLDIAQKEEVKEISNKKERIFNEERILLVEDNPINVMVGKQLLEKSKLKVDAVNNGLKGVERLKAESYDLILMDINMPVMDGYEATREIRKFNSEIPILALSAEVFSEIKDKINDCGMNGFIYKPFTPEDLLSQVEAFLTK